MIDIAFVGATSSAAGCAIWSLAPALTSKVKRRWVAVFVLMLATWFRRNSTKSRSFAANANRGTEMVTFVVMGFTPVRRF